MGYWGLALADRLSRPCWEQDAIKLKQAHVCGVLYGANVGSSCLSIRFTFSISRSSN
jgi:hypothetical protein